MWRVRKLGLWLFAVGGVLFILSPLIVAVAPVIAVLPLVALALVVGGAVSWIGALRIEREELTELARDEMAQR